MKKDSDYYAKYYDTISHTDIGLSDTFRYALWGAFSPLAITGVVGNMTVLYVIGYKKAKKFGSDAAICVMSVYEVLLLLVVVLYDDKTTPKSFKYSTIGCKLLAPLIPVVVQTNLWLKVYVAYSRMR